jgi:hypothetical protein
MRCKFKHYSPLFFIYISHPEVSLYNIFNNVHDTKFHGVKFLLLTSSRCSERFRFGSDFDFRFSDQPVQVY